MSIRLVRATGQWLTNLTGAVPALPFTVCMWNYSVALANAGQTMWSVGDNSSGTHYLSLGQSGSSTFRLSARGGGTETSVNAGTQTADAWHFVIGRFISDTNRRMAILHASGAVAQTATATSRTVTYSTMGIGQNMDGDADRQWDGRLAEYTLFDRDIGINSAADLPNEMVWQLAFRGPFALPHLVSSIVEYRSLRSHPRVNGERDTYFGKHGVRNWALVSTPMIGPHPPLRSDYAHPPRAGKKILMPSWMIEPAAAGGTAVPVFYHHYQQQHNV